MNKPLYRAYLLKEQLREIFRLPLRPAVPLLDTWLAWAQRSRLRPFVKLAQSVTAWCNSMRVESALAVGVGVLLLGAVWYWERRTRRSTRKPFAGRPSMSMDELHAAFYAQSEVSKVDLEVALREIRGALGVAAGCLRPSDRIDVELAPAKAGNLTTV